MIHSESSASEGAAISSDECRLQLDRILSSSDFEATGREHRFLKYVVDETLAGRSDRIKAYSIAVEVFGRDASFNPQTDPIVRIEAGHLRRALERYYFKAGSADPILITIPKGGYVPTFAPLPVAADAPAEPAAAPAPAIEAPARLLPTSWPVAALALIAAALAFVLLQQQTAGTGPNAPEIPRLLVATFDDLSRTSSSTAIASGLTQEVIGQLAKFKDIVVVESVETTPGKATSAPRYALAGSVDASANSFRLRVRLVNQSDGSVLWANSYDGDMKVAQLVQAQSDIAQNVATSLAQTYGVIFQADTARNLVNPPDDWSAYSCTLSYYAYRASLDREALAEVRACLEKAVQRFPNYATAWGLLAQTYMEEIRFGIPLDLSSGALERASAMARRAVELDPHNIRGLQAQMFGLYFNREFDAGRSVGERALAINPNDTELMGEFGYRLALSGDWDKGCALIAQARERNPGPFAYYETGLALCSYISGDMQSAVMWIKKSTIPTNPIYHLIAAAIYAEAGDKLAAEREHAWLRQNAPVLEATARAEVLSRLGRQEDAALFLKSLEKAGLPVKG